MFAVLVAAGSIWQMSPPAPLPASASPLEFSAVRAARHIAVIAASPHPAGSAANARVREYLVRELNALGLETHVQSTVGVTPRFASMGVVNNVVARLRGRDSDGRAVLLVAHYDSQAAGPGAGDDAHGVAAILESIRALRFGAQLRDDVIVLFTDGEEDGLLGASAFVDEHRWAKNVGVLVNFEGRGNRGPAVMFQTSLDNDWLIGAFGVAVPYPVASSVSQEVYRRMPNDTDFTIFNQRQFRGLNFAHLGGWPAYHTPLDTADALDLSTLQHHGTSALGLARYLGERKANEPSHGDAVYFGLPVVGLVRYPAGWATPLAVIGLAAFGVAAFCHRGSQGWRLSRILIGIVASFVTIAATTVFLPGVWFALTALHRHWLPEGDIANSRSYAVAMIALGVALHALLFNVRRNWLGQHNTLYGSLALWVVFGLAAARLAPGASYTFAWPLLFGLASAFVADRLGSRGWLGLLILMVPVLLLLAPLIYWLVVIFGVTSVGAIAVGVQVVLLLEILTPQLAMVATESRWLTAAASAAVGLLFLVIGLTTVRYSPHHPQASDVFYALEGDGSRALWASPAPAPDAWSRGFVTNEPGRAALPLFFPAFFTDRPDAVLLTHDAETVALPPPGAELLESHDMTEGRLVRLRLSPARGGRWLTILLPQSVVRAASIDGRPFERDPAARRGSKAAWAMTYINPPLSGIEVSLSLQEQGPLHVRVIEMTAGLPTLRDSPKPSRPRTTVPFQSGDATLVGRTVVF